MDAAEENSNGEGAFSRPNQSSNNGGLSHEIDISEEIENYLSNLSQGNYEFVDPKLKRERQKLLDLLTSYKKLSEQLDKKCAEASKHGIEIPSKQILSRRAEIYALLHPEIYRNPREEEKKNFIEKFSSKRQFTEVDKVCPPDLTPIHYPSDKRQQEKERFCRLIASAPTRFHNVLGQPSPRFKRLTRPPSTPPSHIDVRENEKERLARIFSTSAAFVRDPNLKRKILQKYKEQQIRPSSSGPVQTRSPQKSEREMCQAALQPANQENSESQLNSVLNEMVRIGEYSPLNKQTSPAQGRTVLGVGENDEKRKLLVEERHRDFANFRERERIAKADKSVMVSPPTSPIGRASVSSASTQTDDSLSDVDSPVQLKPFQVTSPKAYLDVSPREKLLSDLYGYRTSSDVAREEKSKRIAYAQALEEQIREKKRLEEERKLREKEEEELEERRYREQAERLQREYDVERHQKLDFVIQRQAQEELLRKRLAELDMAAKELKRRERLNKFNSERDTSPGSVPLLNHLATAHTGLQVHENGGRLIDREINATSNVNVLPEQLPETNWDQDWSQMSLEGVDLLREHRTQKERLQLPPVSDATTKVERRKPNSNPTRVSPNTANITSTTRASPNPVRVSPNSTKVSPRRSEATRSDGYVPSTAGDTVRRAQSYRQQAEAILKAPLEETIVHQDGPPQRSTVSLPPSSRPKSPVLPAVRTESMLKRNSRILDDKWKVPPDSSHELGRTQVDKDNILTQLGAFRRQLAKEHHRLEERIRGQSSS